MPANGWRELPAELGDGEVLQAGRRLACPVALTGATGFVGSHVLDALLRAGVAVRVLARNPSRLRSDPGAFEVVEGGLEDREALERVTSGAAVVLHLAGLVRAAGEEAFDRANRVGTENLVAVLASGAGAPPLVHVSSLAAGGPSEDPEGLRPEDEPRPVSAYGRSKLAGERAVRAYPHDWAILRPPAIYGPRDIDVLQFFRLAARGLVPIPAGERWLTVAHVTDVVRAILAAAAGEGRGRVLHLGEPRPHRLDVLVRELASAGGVKARIIGVPAVVLRLAGRGGDLLQRLGRRDVAMTSDKARELLAAHWSARTEGSLRLLGLDGSVPFGEGAAATWAWYRAHGWLPRGKITGL